MTEDEILDNLMDRLINAIKKGALRPILNEVAKDACEHVLLRLGIAASNPDHVIDFQENMHHLRNFRITFALTSQRMLEFEIWKKHHDETCEGEEKLRAEAIARIEKELEDGTIARRWIRRRMDFFIVTLIGCMGTLIWFLLTNKVIIVVNP